MATPWNSSTAYSPNAVVSYNGFVYVRSRYPITATTGTPPDQEMGVDDSGFPIRTWTLNSLANGGQTNLTYFRTDILPYDSELSYAGMTAAARSAYGAGFAPPEEYEVGMTAEFDQFKVNTAPTPANPECPADECGIAMQFLGLGIFYQLSINSGGAGNRTKFHYLRFNHALFFRRSFSFLSIIKTTTTFKTSPPSPAVVTYDYISTNNYIPDDRNFCDQITISDYFVSANSIFSIVIPADVDDADKTVVYFYEGAAITSIEDGD